LKVVFFEIGNNSGNIPENIAGYIIGGCVFGGVFLGGEIQKGRGEAPPGQEINKNESKIIQEATTTRNVVLLNLFCSLSFSFSRI
jgi:hypothetical protein